MITVQLDTTPLLTGHAHRGIGRYTRELAAELKRRRTVELLETTQPAEVSKLKPDLIHYPYFDLFFPTLPVRRPAPTVVTVHDVIPLRYPAHYKPGIKGRAALWRQRWLVQRVEAVITDSQASKQDIIRYLGVSDRKVFVVPLAAQPEITRSKQSQIITVKQKLQLPDAYILYVGDINYNKNLPQLIKALKFIPEHIHLVCVGKNFIPQPIPEWKWIESQLALSNVESRVKFITDLGPEAVEDLAAIYSGALAYVQPSLAEGFGLPVLEAMQCRVPVVITDTAALVEVAGAQAVVVQPTAEGLAQGITTVAGWSERVRSDRTRRASLWASKFTWSRTAVETVKVYQQVLHEQKT